MADQDTNSSETYNNSNFTCAPEVSYQRITITIRGEKK